MPTISVLPIARFVILSEAKDRLVRVRHQRQRLPLVQIVHHVAVCALFFQIELDGPARVLRLTSSDATNRLNRACVFALTAALGELKRQHGPLIVAGNRQFFSVGADLN